MVRRWRAYSGDRIRSGGGSKRAQRRQEEEKKDLARTAAHLNAELTNDRAEEVGQSWWQGRRFSSWCERHRALFDILRGLLR